MVTERLPVHVNTLDSSSSATPTSSHASSQAQSVNASSPAILLSSNPHHFNMLFDLLGCATDPTIVDELWALIRRLPAPFPLLQHWVNLDEGKSVLDMLLTKSPLPTTTATATATATSAANKATSLSDVPPLLPIHALARLLYHLEIIEALLEPACLSKNTDNSTERGGSIHTSTTLLTTTTTTSSSSSNSNSDSTTNSSTTTSTLPPVTISDALLAMGYDCVDPLRVAIWPAAFLAKGGLEALLRVYEWLASSFTRAEPSPLPLRTTGTSPVMILRAIELTVRLVRSFYVRACVATIPTPTALSVMQLLEETRLARTQSTVNSTKGAGANAGGSGSSFSSAGAGGGDKMIGPSLPPSMVADKEAHRDNVSSNGEVGVDLTSASMTTNGQHSTNGLLQFAANGHHNDSHLVMPIASGLGLGLGVAGSGGDANGAHPLLPETDADLLAVTNLLGKEWGNGVVPPGGMGDKVWALLSLRVRAIDAAAVQSASLALLTLIQG